MAPYRNDGVAMRVLALLLASVMGLSASIAGAADIDIVWLERRLPPPPVLSNLEPVPADLGLMGAALGIADSNTTGKFLNQSYTLTEVVIEKDAPLTAAMLAGADLVVAKLPAADLLALADLPGAAGALILNATAADDALRRGGCRANLFHTLPSRAMLADALGQFLLKKRWKEIFLVSGPTPADAAFADAIRRAAAKFGLEITDDRPWPFAADLRRSAGREVPVFTQVDDHDVMVVTDEAGVGLLADPDPVAPIDRRVPLLDAEGHGPAGQDRLRRVHGDPFLI